MVNLERTHPDYHPATVRGTWTVQRSAESPFASVAADQAIEQTINRQSKTAGGIIGFTLNPGIFQISSLPHLLSSWDSYTFNHTCCMLSGASQRWVLSEPDRSSITHTCEDIVGLSPESREHHELGPARMKTDEKAVLKVMETINGMINPWTTDSEHLISISSARECDDRMEQDLLSAEDRGEISAIHVSSAFLLVVHVSNYQRSQ